MLIGDEYVNKTSQWPRRPLVVLVDIVVAIVAFVLLVSVEHFLSQVYAMVAVVLFTISATYHWLPHRHWLHVCDRAMIFVMIAVTPLPYLASIAQTPFVWAYILSATSAIIGVIVLLKGKLLYKGNLPMVAYAVTYITAGISIVGSALSPVFAQIWVVGGVLYAVQAVVYIATWPTLRWHRVVQHACFLAPAFLCHAWVVYNL